jgi:hypothetical protein
VIYFSDFGGDVITLIGATEEVLETAPATGGAGYRLTSGGLEESGTGTAASILYGTIGNWVTPTGNAGLYEVRATLNSGAVSSGTTGSWLALTSTRTWTVTRGTVGVSSANLTIEVRRASDGVVLGSAPVVLTVDIS